GLAVRSALERDVGWKPGSNTFALVRIPYGPFPTPGHRAALFETLRERMASISSVEDVALAAFLPVLGYPSTPIVVDGAPPVPPGQEPVVSINYADPSFFSSLAIRLHEGTVFPDPGSGVFHRQ